MYAQLLDEAVRTLKGQAPKVDVDPDLNIKLNARIRRICTDNQLRLRLYRRLANAQDEEHVLAISDEIADRFGPAPAPAQFDRSDAHSDSCKGSPDTGCRSQSRPGSFYLSPTNESGYFHHSGTGKISGSQYRVPADFRLAYAFDAEERKDTLRAIRMCLQNVTEQVTQTIES